MRTFDARRQAFVSGTRITRTLQHGGFGRPQRVVVREGAQGFVERGRGLGAIATAHPHQSGEIALRLDVLRLQPQAVPQRGFGAIERAQRDQAAGVRVTESRRSRLPRARVPRQAFGFLVTVRGLQCDRQRMRCGDIAGRIRRQTPVERNRLVLASECDQ